ncbi:exopolysaccharide transport family protein [Salmonirosea aquatica]|uniref:Lipopolysaccharide biosynthesis protein n=1 Tax=Salmonirosea aquatica TaxID=2654236 RepID=A0A7C9B7T6_9BACT|nr:lipopolysaccharide biosynthesis protein [Cytophagaceae bacterium SJW1-29]
MTELGYFLKFLRKRLYILLLVPLVAMVVCFFLTRQLPDTYRSQGRLATGIVDKTDQLIVSEDAPQESEINRSFDNVIQLMRMKQVLDQVSYRLLIHDLMVPPDSTFRPLSRSLNDMSAASKKQLLAILRQKYTAHQPLSAGKPQEALVLDLIAGMEYDASSLLDKLTIYRIATSDYINIEFEGRDPRMTAFVVNTLCEEFLSLYARRMQESSNRSLEFFEKMMLQKRDALNARMEELKSYKIQNKVLNLNEQARSLYGHIIDFETRREIAKKDVVAYRAALKNIDQRFDPADRRYLESNLAELNQRIAVTKETLQITNDQYIRNNFDPRLKNRVDSLQQVLNRQIRASTDQVAYSPLSAKGDLITHKLELEIALELAQNSIASIEAEVNRLNRKYDGMVPNEASIQQFETSIEIAGKEYIEALQRYNNARLESFSPITLKLVERATLGTLQPSKKMLLVLLAGLSSLVVCLFVFFLLYFLDSSIRTTAQLADTTGLPVLGRINRISGDDFLQKLDDSAQADRSTVLFRDLIRSIRYEIDEETSNPKVISVTSLHDNAGKTNLVYGLAWAYERIHQRVVILDGNFAQPTLSQQARKQGTLEDFFQTNQSQLFSETGNILATAGGDVSLLEIADERTIQEKLDYLKQHYDVILIETPALSTLNKAKEWIAFSDRVVAVFPFGKGLRDADKVRLNYLRSRGAILSGWVLTGTPYDIEPIGKSLTKI